MPVSYSVDLRWRVVWLCEFLDVDPEAVARTMNISKRSVHRYCERYRVTGDVKPCVKRNGPMLELCEFEQLYLTQLVLTKPGIYLRELQEELYAHTLHWVDVATICRTLQRIGMTRQVIRHYAWQRSELSRAEFWLEFWYHSPEMIIWIDESGFNKRNALRKYGYGIRGVPPQDFTLTVRGTRYSAIGILSTEGVEDVYITEESVDGDTFLHFVRTCLLPLLQSFDGYSSKSVVVLDNASIHHVTPVIETIRSVGAIVRFLPAYSPDMNPIENVFGEVKQYLQANESAFQVTSSPKTILMSAFLSVTKENCKSYISHCGYH